MIEKCAKLEIDEQGHQRKHLANVDCEKKCESCGWNPEEQERRLKTGKFMPIYKRRGWDETKKEIEVTLPEGTKQLVFKKREEVSV